MVCVHIEYTHMHACSTNCRVGVHIVTSDCCKPFSPREMESLLPGWDYTLNFVVIENCTNNKDSTIVIVELPW